MFLRESSGMQKSSTDYEDYTDYQLGETVQAATARVN
jgi:hypothetical protein